MSANSDALAAAVRCWNTADFDGYLRLYDDSIRLHGYSPQAMDKAAVKAFYYGIFDAFSELGLTLHETVEQGDRLAARFTMTGVHTGTFMGVPGTGRPIALDGITVLHFREGCCVERWACADMLGLMVQIGAPSSY